MFSNVKLPHWAMLAISIASAVVAWLIAHNASGDITLPAAVVGALPFVQTAIGWLSPSTMPTANLRAARAAKLVPPVAVLALALLVGCTKDGQLPGPVVVSLDTATCLLNTYSADIASGMSVAASTADAAAHCLVPLIEAQKFLDAHHAAEVRERAAGDGGAP